MARYNSQARSFVKSLFKSSLLNLKDSFSVFSENNVSVFHRHVSKKPNSAHRVVPIGLRDVNDRIITDDISKALASNSCFASVFNARPSSPRAITINNFKTT